MAINREEIESLVRQYISQRDQLHYGDSMFSEADTRSNFIDPFFAALNWDIYNHKALQQSLREVIRETQVGVVNENTKRPDYAFKLGPERKFFAEAKRPSVNIMMDAKSSFQVRRYGWSANLPISVLTNFENLIIFDTTNQPYPSQNANHSRLQVFSYEEYITRLDVIAQLISRDSVYSGEFDSTFSQQVDHLAIENVDDVFLETLNRWRLELGNDLLQHYPDIDNQQLNEIIQRFILRILFLRMCEDRGIETYERLRGIASDDNWKSFINLLRESDNRFDSNLFSIANDPFFYRGDRGIRLDSVTVNNIIENLYFPQAPYTFSVFEPDFLGNVYEQFLIEQVDIEDQKAILTRKPENVGRDVIPTPRPIINRLVRETIIPRISDLTLDDLLQQKVLDPACGSGGFLIAALMF